MIKNNKKIWYICDYKILKKFRKLKLYKKFISKYFISFYMQASTMFCVNMSPNKNNHLIKYIKNIFSFFNIKEKPLYLYSFKKEEFKQLQFLNTYDIITNNGQKNIIINNTLLPIYHLTKNNNFH